ncbi:MAG: hypothetical protein E1N59_732 [Puniceicoccaceae bacterium 5H]|nr:MAG: hypothetical protein E1N59_732 [Puniceicoccaceae bacterium 5H]
MNYKNLPFISVSTLGVTASALGGVHLVTDPLTLDADGDQWFLEGGATGSTLVADFGLVSSGGTNAGYGYGGLNAFFPQTGANNFKVALNGQGQVKYQADGVEISDGLFTSSAGSNLLVASGFEFANTWDEFVTGSMEYTMGKTGYFAFKFDSGSGTQYGWANVSISQEYVTLHQWAWADSGEILNVGGTEATPTTPSVPEPKETIAALGLLAAGAVGMRRYLQSRQRAA